MTENTDIRKALQSVANRRIVKNVRITGGTFFISFWLFLIAVQLVILNRAIQELIQSLNQLIHSVFIAQ